MVALFLGMFLMAEDAIAQDAKSSKVIQKTELTQQKAAYKTAKLQFKTEHPNATKPQRRAFVAEMRQKYPLAFSHIRKN